MFEDTKGVIRNHKSKDRQYIDQKKKDKNKNQGDELKSVSLRWTICIWIK